MTRYRPQDYYDHLSPDEQHDHDVHRALTSQRAARSRFTGRDRDTLHDDYDDEGYRL